MGSIDDRAYHDDEWHGAQAFNDYQQILGALHPEYRWFHGSDADYQGYWWSAGVDANGQWAVKQGSFGSCSGCDQLQGIEDEEGALSLLGDIDHILEVHGVDILTYLEQAANNEHSYGEDAIREVQTKIRAAGLG